MIEALFIGALVLWFALFLAIPSEPRGPSIEGPNFGPRARALSRSILAGLAALLIYGLFYF
jgi:hypothetical protein